MDFLDEIESARERPQDIDFASELNEEQLEAVTSELGPAIVLAGAGSGKTRTLTYRVAWLLSQGVPPHRILLLTFTNKAAREMLHRVEDLTGIESRAFWGGTFHHVGQKILRYSGQPVGIGPSFNIMDEGDSESLLTETIREVDPSFLKNKNHPKTRPLRHLISFSRNTRQPLGELAAREYPFFDDLPGKVERFAETYRKKRREQQVCDYDDLLEGWLELFRQSPETAEYWRERFDYVLVDEYQDTNSLQSELVDLIASKHRVMAVGDDAQCIYTWRGANFENIVTFPDRHPGTRIFKIETNYRSTPNILNFANGILEYHPSTTGYEKELRAVREAKRNPRLVTTVDTREQAAAVIEKMQAMLDQGYRPGDMAVLYRAHYQAMDLQMQLSKQHIPFQITSGIRFFEQAHIRDVAAQLRFIANPRDTTAFLRFTSLLPKVGPKTVEKIYRAWVELAEKEKRDLFEVGSHKKVVDRVPTAAREEWVSLVQSLHDGWMAAKDEEKPSELVRLIVEGWYSLYLRQTYPNWRDREDDLQSLIGFAGQYPTLTDLLSQLILLNSETTDRSIEDDGEKIRLTTIHQAKGLEFPVVFVIGLADGQFPLNRAIEEDNLDEERRLFYVAVTRAMDELYLFYPKLMSQGGPMRLLGPSRFLQEVPHHRYEKERFNRNYW